MAQCQLLILLVTELKISHFSLLTTAVCFPKEWSLARQWWRTPLIPAQGGRGRRTSEFEASLVYRESSRAAKANTEKPCLEKIQKNKNKNKKHWSPLSKAQWPHSTNRESDQWCYCDPFWPKVVYVLVLMKWGYRNQVWDATLWNREVSATELSSPTVALAGFISKCWRRPESSLPQDSSLKRNPASVLK